MSSVLLQLWCDSAETRINSSDSTLALPASTWPDISICAHPEVNETHARKRQHLHAFQKSIVTVTLPCVQYMVLSGVVAMVTCAVFLRLSCVLKLAVLLLAAALYAYLIETHR